MKIKIVVSNPAPVEVSDYSPPLNVINTYLYNF